MEWALLLVLQFFPPPVVKSFIGLRPGWRRKTLIRKNEIPSGNTVRWLATHSASAMLGLCKLQSLVKSFLGLIKIQSFYLGEAKINGVWRHEFTILHFPPRVRMFVLFLCVLLSLSSPDNIAAIWSNHNQNSDRCTRNFTTHIPQRELFLVAFEICLREDKKLLVLSRNLWWWDSIVDTCQSQMSLLTWKTRSFQS